MKARRIISVILCLLPIAVAAAGIVWGLYWTVFGPDAEGWQWVIVFTTALPIAGVLAIPCAIAALCLNGKGGLLFVKIVSIIDLVWGTPFAIYGLLLLTSLISV